MRLPSFLTATAAAVASVLCLPAMAHAVTYVGTLSNVGETAPVSGPSLGTGSVQVILNEDTFEMIVHATFSGLTGTTTNSHIHCCTAVANSGTAGVATVTPTFTDFPPGVTFGTYDKTFNMALAASYNPAFVTANGGTASSAFAALATGMAAGSSYFNIHTSAVGSGEIRAFLALAPVPEPQSYALLLGGLGLIGWAARRCSQA